MIEATVTSEQEQTEAAADYAGSATYSPEDNKLRLYPFARLDDATYKRVKEAGFAWAPKQELFVAPMWTPSRADLLAELCGEIGDEDTTLAERAEDRAERFEDYGDARKRDAAQAQEAVRRLADGIPFGQPILVGHHSERRARKDAQRITDGMRKAVQMWDTADYWRRRAAGAVANAKYKERADVRARRIKTIEAAQRKAQRALDDAARFLKAWAREGLTMEQAKAIANYSHVSRCYTLAEYPRELPASQYEGPMSTWSALDGGVIDAAQARAIELRAHERSQAWQRRWVEHYANRLLYERAMLGEQGGTAADRNAPQKGGAVQCWVNRGAWLYVQKVNKVSVTVADNWGNGGENFTRTVPFDKLTGLMAAADVQAARDAGRLHELPDGTGFVLAPPPKGDEPEQGARGVEAPAPDAQEGGDASGSAPAVDGQALAQNIDAMRASLRAGVQAVSAPQLFPTPAGIAARMVDELRPALQCRLLEPSAGTGRLLRALPGVLPFGFGSGPRQTWCGEVVAVDVDRKLCAALVSEGAAHRVVCADFLACSPHALAGNAAGGDPQPLGLFDAVLMNPPFENGADVQHIQHAAGFLRAGGRLVALCAAGPRQVATLKPWAEDSGGSWELLPEGSFVAEGTNVRAAMLVFEAGAA